VGVAMGKSIRSKRKKRLRTIKREIVIPHYDEKVVAKMAVQEAALAQPKIELPKKRQGACPEFCINFFTTSFFSL
jgi:hypothetical protein